MDDLVEHTAAAIAKATGEDEPPPMCPWRCAEDPLMAVVYAARRRKDAGLSVEEPCMSLRAREAIAHYDRCYALAVADRRETEDRMRRDADGKG